MQGITSKFLRYILTGGIAAVVDAAGFAVLIGIGLPVGPAATASFLVATVANYSLTSRIVFRHNLSLRGYSAFFVAALGGLVINLGTTEAVVIFMNVAPIIAKITGIGTAFMFNFFLNVRFVFRPKPQPSRAL